MAAALQFLQENGLTDYDALAERTAAAVCPEGGRIRPRSGSDGAADRGTSGHGVQKSPAGLGAPQQAFLQSKNRKCIDTCPACQECVPS